MPLKIHHLNCGSLYPRGGFLVKEKGFIWEKAKWVCHCLLIESDSGLILVDTGLGVMDTLKTRGWFHTVHLKTLLLARLNVEETAYYQIKKMGFNPDDVRHIILTHLDLDHAGGIADFPRATIHVMAKEYEAAMARSFFKERFRYSPLNWNHNPKWNFYEVKDGEPWFGFEGVKLGEGLPPEILLVPMHGHTQGHAGIAINTGKNWVLHAGDSYVHKNEIRPHQGPCPKGLKLFEKFISAMDYKKLCFNQDRLQRLIVNNPEIHIFSAHDPDEFELEKEKLF